jgi:hypothetical protein
MACMGGLGGARPGAGFVSRALAIGPDGGVLLSAPVAGAGRLTDLLPAPGGGYLAVLVPRSQDPGSGGRPRAVVLSRLDARGAEIWSDGYGDAEGRPAATFAAGTDGALFAAGTVRMPASPGRPAGREAWAMKLSP